MKRGCSSHAARLGLWALLALFALGALVRIALPGGPREPNSFRSSGPEGALAAILLLEELGFAPERFTAAYARLPRGGGLLWLPEKPRLPAHLFPRGEKEPQAPLGPSWHDPRHPRHLGRFVRTGGVLVAPASDAARALVAAALDVDPGELPRGRAASAGAVRLESGERLRLAVARRLGVSAACDPDALDSPWSAWARDGAGEPVVLSRPFAEGLLVIVPDGGWFTNAQLAEADHALLFTRVVEQAYAGGALLFDESAAGGFQAPGPLALAFSPAVLGFTVHALLALALLTWRTAWPRAFPRDPEPLESTGALARARMQAALFMRADRCAALADALRDGVLVRLARRGSGLLSPDGLDAQQRRRLWNDVLAARGVPLEEVERVGLLGPPPRDAAGLARLGEMLAQFEARLGGEAQAVSSAASLTRRSRK